MDREGEWRKQRGTMIGVLLSIMVGAGILAFSFMVCGGYPLYFLGIVLGFTALGCVHYYLWGRSLSQEVAQEREAEELRQRLEADPWSGEADEPHDYGR